MIGIDTNVLVRYVARDDPAQSAAATKLLEERCTADDPGWIGLIVVCEMVWVLQRVYHLDRHAVSRVIETLLTSVELKVESADVVWQALRKFRKGTADMADYVIGAANAANDAAPTFTFDKRAADDITFELLET